MVILMAKYRPYVREQISYAGLLRLGASIQSSDYQDRRYRLIKVLNIVFYRYKQALDLLRDK